MKKLPVIISKNGLNYSLVERKGNVALYKQEVSEKVFYYEAFIVRVKPACVFKGKQIEEREVFTSEGNFGKTAWSCKTLPEALDKMNSINSVKCNRVPDGMERRTRR